MAAKGYVLGIRNRNSWMTDLEIEELETKVTGSDSVIVEEARSVEAFPDHVGEAVRNVLQEMGVEEQADNLYEEEVAIVKENEEVIGRGRKDKLPSFFYKQSIFEPHPGNCLSYSKKLP